MSKRALLEVLTKPGSHAPGIWLAGGSIQIRVREPAIEGRANDACRAALAAAIDVPRAAVVLVRGARSRRKLFSIAGLTAEQVLQRLGSSTAQKPTPKRATR